MSFGYYLKLYLAALAAFLAVDLVWLGVVARKLYAQYLGYLLAPQTNLTAAALFYLLYLVGVIVFAVLPGLEAGSLKTALLRGALFGLICYATYDLTNLATIKDWPLTITIIDMIWGTVLTTTITLITYLVGDRLL